MSKTNGRSRYNLRNNTKSTIIRTVNLRKRPTVKINNNKNNNNNNNNKLPITRKSRKPKKVIINDDFNESDNDSNLDLESQWADFNKYRGGSNVVEKKDWVSATGVKNYLMKDPIIDFLDIYYIDNGLNITPKSTYSNKQNGSNTDDNHENKLNDLLQQKKYRKDKLSGEKSELEILFKMGNLFEKKVCEHLTNKYPNMVRTVLTDFKYLSPELMEVTKKYMHEGIPIILQAPLYNYQNKTNGVADILIRSDWINIIFNTKTLSDDTSTIKSPLLNNVNYHYRVIDIKWSTIYLCSNGKNIRNSDRIPAYKGQLAIYNAILGQLQGYTPNEAYILGKAWNINGGEDNGYNCYDLLGCISYDGFDFHYIKETANAIEWMRNVRNNGHKWTCFPPSVPELYPNMNNKNDIPYHSIKKQIANHIHEVTEIWMVGIKHRKHAHTQNILGWNDIKCTSKTLGIKGKKVGPTIDKILEINRSIEGPLLSPKYIINNTSNWQESSDIEFYVDFETLNSCLASTDINLQNSKTNNAIVFMIGIWYKNIDIHKWEYVHFTSPKASILDEKLIVIKFVDFIESTIKKSMLTNNINIDLNNRLGYKPKLFHWGHAERTIFNSINARNNHMWNNWLKMIEWIDLCKIFTDEPIVIKNAKKFNLKEIANVMQQHKYITTKWESNGPSNGFDAMMGAVKYYQFMDMYNSLDNENKQKYFGEYTNMMVKYTQIIEYNEVDCKVMWEIVSYLRNNHIHTVKTHTIGNSNHRNTNSKK